MINIDSGMVTLAVFVLHTTLAQWSIAHFALLTMYSHTIIIVLLHVVHASLYTVLSVHSTPPHFSVHCSVCSQHTPTLQCTLSCLFTAHPHTSVYTVLSVHSTPPHFSVHCPVCSHTHPHFSVHCPVCSHTPHFSVHCPVCSHTPHFSVHCPVCSQHTPTLQLQWLEKAVQMLNVLLKLLSTGQSLFQRVTSEQRISRYSSIHFCCYFL